MRSLYSQIISKKNNVSEGWFYRMWKRIGCSRLVWWHVVRTIQFCCIESKPGSRTNEEHLEFASSVVNPHLEYDSKTLESAKSRATLT